MKDKAKPLYCGSQECIFHDGDKCSKKSVNINIKEYHMLFGKADCLDYTVKESEDKK